MNAQILARVNHLPSDPELIDQPIRRCDEMLRDLHSIRAMSGTPQAGGPAPAPPSAGATGQRV